MIVRLNHHQWNSLRQRLPELHVSTMHQHRTKVSRYQHDYLLPAIAWRQILDLLQSTCYGPLGGRLDRGVSRSTYTAIKRIADVIRRAEGHPSLKERGVMGVSSEVLPAWTSLERADYSIYPVDGWPFRLMWPNVIDLHGTTVTIWIPMDPTSCSDAEELTYREDFHLLFRRHRVVDADR